MRDRDGKKGGERERLELGKLNEAASDVSFFL